MTQPHPPTHAGHVGTRQREHVEDRVLSAAAQLDPADDSLTARQLRGTAASIRDHRTSPTTTDAGTATDTTAVRAGGWPAESLDRVVDTMREALDGRQQMPPFRPADQATEAERRLGWVSAPTTDTPPQRVRQSIDLAVAALQVRDCLDRITPPLAAGRGHDQAADNTTTDQAEAQAAVDDH